MTRNLSSISVPSISFPSISLSSIFIRCSAIAFALGAAVACAPSGDAPDVASSGVNLALMGSSEANTNLHVLLKSNGKDGEKRDVALHANANANATFQLEPGEHVLAIVCTDEEGNELLGTGTATFETKADTDLMILVDVDSLIDGEEIPAEVVEEAAAELEASAEAEAEADADTETEEGSEEAGSDTNVDADVNVNVDEDGVDADADVNADTETSANADANASTNSDGATTDANADASTADDTSANANASAGIAVVTEAEADGETGEAGQENECDDTCQAECLEELLDLCGF